MFPGVQVSAQVGDVVGNGVAELAHVVTSVDVVERNEETFSIFLRLLLKIRSFLLLWSAFTILEHKKNIQTFSKKYYAVANLLI